MARFDPLSGRIVQDGAVPSVQLTANPSSTDTNYPIPYIAVNNVTNDAFILTSVDGGVATWKTLTSPGGSTGSGSVIAFVNPTQPPPSQNNGEKYILGTQAGTIHSAWGTASRNSIVTYNGTVWVETPAASGMTVFVNAESRFVVFTSSWVALNTLLSDATNTSKGLAQFDATDFTVTGGLVEVNPENLAFDNTGTLLTADTFQAAIKELWEAQIDFRTTTAPSFTAEVNAGYTLKATSAQTIITLPATAEVSDTITIICFNPYGFRVYPQAGQVITVFNSVTSPGGYIEFVEFGSEITLTCYEANAGWYIRSPSGNLNII